MRVLMLGWDFSPRLSGGVGSACQGLATALARTDARTEVLFVLPRLHGDEEPEKVRLLASEAGRAPPEWVGRENGAHAAEPLAEDRARESAFAARASELERVFSNSAFPSAHASARAPGSAAPTLPAPSESLRLLSIDSPLRPYLAPADYAPLVGALLARIQHEPPAPVPQRAARAATTRAPAAQLAKLLANASGSAATSSALPLLAQTDHAPVPPYGPTLVSEVERYARAVLALVQHETFDVIHAHDWMTFPAALLVQERTHKPLVVHFHSCEAERRGAQGSRDARAIEQAALDAAERVVCVSEASARTLRGIYAIDAAKLRVLHNAYTPLGTRPRRTTAAAPVVLYLGRLAEQKAPDVFLEAAARVHARHPRARFVLAGAGELYPELSALARELGIADRVRFTGFVAGPALARAYATADVYVLPSRAEPFGISALEALSLGVPTIVARDAGVTEVVRSVLRFEPGDVDGLADKIVALLEQPALQKQLVSAGLREVRKLRWEKPARALRGLYDELVVPTP